MPLDEKTAVSASLAALVARRDDALDVDGKDGDDMARGWARPSAAAEETLLVLPRLAALAHHHKKGGHAFRGCPPEKARHGWIVEADGALTACALTACTLAAGARALVREHGQAALQARGRVGGAADPHPTLPPSPPSSYTPTLTLTSLLTLKFQA